MALSIIFTNRLALLMIRLTIYTIFLLLGLILPIKIHAQQNEGVTVSPVGIDVNIKPEEIFNNSYSIINNKEVDFNIRFKEGTVDQTINAGDLEWFKLNKEAILLPASSSIDVNFRILVPKGTPEGVYNKILLAELYTDSNSEIISLSIPFKVNIIIDSLFAGTGGVEIKDFNVENKLLLDNYVNLNFTVVNDSGSSLTRPIGNLNIINPTGTIVYSTVINESLHSLTNSKSYNIQTTLPSIGLSDVGQYTAQLLLTDSITNKSTSERITFVVVNKIYLVIFFVFIVLVLIFTKFRSGLFEIIKVNKSYKANKSIGNKKPEKKVSSK